VGVVGIGSKERSRVAGRHGCHPQGTAAVQTTRLLQLMEQLVEGKVNEQQVAAMLHPTPFMAQLLTLFDLWDVNASGKLEEDGA